MVFGFRSHFSRKVPTNRAARLWVRNGIWMRKDPSSKVASADSAAFWGASKRTTGACSFTLSGSVPSTAGVATTRGFIATGLNQGSNAAFSDCEEFFPNQVYNQYD